MALSIIIFGEYSTILKLYVGEQNGHIFPYIITTVDYHYDYDTHWHME